MQNEEKKEGELKDEKRPKRQINQMQTEEFVWILIQANKQLDKQNEKGKFETFFFDDIKELVLILTMIIVLWSFCLVGCLFLCFRDAYRHIYG